MGLRGQEWQQVFLYFTRKASSFFAVVPNPKECLTLSVDWRRGRDSGAVHAARKCK